MKSYTICRALDELEKVAGEMPEISYYYHYILGFVPVGKSKYAPLDESLLGVGEKYEMKSKTSVSKAGESLGDYDFFFEWARKPDGKQMRNLIEKIEKVLTPLGCKHTITTK